MRNLIFMLLFVAVSASAEVRYRAPGDHYSDPRYMAGGSRGVVKRFFNGSGRDLYGVENRHNENWRISGVRRQDFQNSLYFTGNNVAGRLIFRRRDAIGSGRRIFGFEPIRH